MEKAIDELTMVIMDVLTDVEASPELFDHVTNLFSELGQSNIVPFQGTVIACHRCSRVNAPKYEARRLGGTYVMLCRDETGGCAGKEVAPQCQFVDNEGIPCAQPASHYIITWGDSNNPEDPRHKHTCIQHMGALTIGQLGIFGVGKHE